MPRPLLPSELERTLPDDGTSISARVRADLETGHEPVDLAKAAKLAARIVALFDRSRYAQSYIAGLLADESHYLARAVLRQGALLDEREARIAELERRT